MPDLLSPLVVVALIAGALLGLLTYCLLKSGRPSGSGPAPADDPAVEEARRVRAESRETRIKIEANVTVGKPSVELFDKAMGLGRFKRSDDDEKDEGGRGREDT